MTKPALDAYRYLQGQGVPIQELLLALRDRVQAMEAAAKAGGGSGRIYAEVHISRGRGLAVEFQDRVRILAKGA